MDFFLSQTSWDLAEGAGESPVPPQLSKGTWAASSGTSLMALTGVEKLKEHLRTRLGLGLSLPRLLAPLPGEAGPGGFGAMDKTQREVSDRNLPQMGRAGSTGKVQALSSELCPLFEQ